MTSVADRGVGPVARSVTAAEPMTAEQQARFDRDGYIIIRGALAPEEVAAARDALDQVYADAAKVGLLAVRYLRARARQPEGRAGQRRAELDRWPTSARD